MNPMISSRVSLMLLASFILQFHIESAGASDSSYQFLKEIPIAGESGSDNLALDESARRLYISHGTKIAVVDIDQENVIGEIPNTSEVHGIAIAAFSAEVHLGFASNWREDKVSFINLQTLKITGKPPTGKNPEAVLFVPQGAELYTFNSLGHSVSVFEADDADPAGTFELPGKPGFATVDPKAKRVYCNIEDKNEVAVIDTPTRKIVAGWPISPGEQPSGMAIDVERHHLFIGCANKLMLMLDSSSGKVLATAPIGAQAGANVFDPATRLVFNSNGEGNITIARQEGRDKLVLVQTLPTEPGTRTIALDPKTHKIYVTSVKKSSDPGASQFTVVVYGMAPASN